MRRLTDSELERLDGFLLHLDDDDAMLLSSLDGLLAGVAVCPEPIVPSEWMPAIWGGDGPGFATIDEADEILGLVRIHYNDVLQSLEQDGAYRPLMELDSDDTELWDVWAEGFAVAVGLRLDSWGAYADSEDNAVRTAFEFLAGLARLSMPDSKSLPDDQDAELREHASEMIAECLETLNAARLALRPQPVRGGPRVGRNDPCPCGSGKKFKKCCMN